MPDSTLEFLVVNLSKIESIIEELPRVGKRSELKVKADEILQLTEMIRKQAYRLADSNHVETYVPDFKQYGGGAAGKKEAAAGPSKQPQLGKNEPAQRAHFGTAERRLQRVKVTSERRLNPWKYEEED